MRNLKATGVTVLLLLWLTWPAAGQGAPAQIDAALSDHGARLGQSIQLSDLSNWRWEQTTFADSALGCAGVGGAGGPVLGYRFLLTFQSQTHDYRVSGDSALVVYCGVVDQSETLSPDVPVYSNRLCPPEAAGGPYMRSRVSPDMLVEAEAGLLNLRAQPTVAGQVLTQIPPGYPFTVGAGPICAEGYLWWRVEFGGSSGYAAEAGAGQRLLMPVRPAALPERETLNIWLAPYIRELAVVRGLFRPMHAWSSDGVYLAASGAPGSDSVWLYDLREQPLAPGLLEIVAGFEQIVFQPGSRQLLLGGEDGSLRLWRILDGDTALARESLYLNAHGGAVSALAFSPDGDRVVSAGPLAFSPLAPEREWSAIVWDLPTVSQASLLSGHRDLIRAIVYSPDGREIATGADDGRLRFWDAASGAPRGAMDLGAPITALAYNSTGDLLAVGLARASDNLLFLDSATRAQSASYPLPTSSVSAIDFSPDDAMLVAGADEAVFTLWDTATREMILARDTGAAVGDVSFSPDGGLIAISTLNSRLSLYGVPRGSG